MFDSRSELWVQGSVAFISFSEACHPDYNNNTAEIYSVLPDGMYILSVLVAFTCINSFNLYSDPVKWVHLLSPFHRKGNW